MLQAAGQILFDHLLQRDARRFLPAADRHLFAVIRVDAHIQRQHNRLWAKLAKPLLHFYWLPDRRRANHHARGARLQQRGDVVAAADAAADLNRHLNARQQRF